MSCDADHRYLHVLTHSFPTRRSSDLLGLQCAACRWLFVETYNVIRMLGEFWPDIFVILLVCSLVSFANQKFGIFVATPITLGSTALTLLLGAAGARSEEHTSDLQSLMRISYAVFCLK